MIPEITNPPLYPLPIALGLGSNLGDRHQILASACKLIATYLHNDQAKFPRFSSIYESAPINCPPNSPSFYNMVALVHSKQPVGKIFNWIRSIETAFGRPLSRPKNEPRILDLDILFYGNYRIESDQIQIPHPHILDRAFVLVPLLEIMPDLTLPYYSHDLPTVAARLVASQSLQIVGKFNFSDQDVH
ncbi:MAG: 2-amino-4-hydroxy-6-hydroxymethyldihydropteridine diphosphokinase [Chthoniobacterales bacterium]|nr:2-amino-4-hydroxy-6-hydroxymethyldihydropteridine diphosphokinase [Chthoniobacterales bacterium]